MRSPLPCYALATSLDTPAVWLWGVECYRLPQSLAKGRKRAAATKVFSETRLAYVLWLPLVK